MKKFVALGLLSGVSVAGLLVLMRQIGCQRRQASIALLDSPLPVNPHRDGTWGQPYTGRPADPSGQELSAIGGRLVS